jgi:hypothetical protein
MAWKPRPLLRIEYEEAAEAYLRSLPPEHFMEAFAQATQRKITVASFEVIAVERPDIQLFNELLLQYPLKRPARIGQVVPDNVAMVHNEPLVVKGSYDLPLQPVGPFWVMEYVSKYTKRKDYEGSFHKYERELKVPYYLLFYPDNQEMTLFRYNGRKYVSVKPNGQGRCAVAGLDVEVALQDGWVRFWFRGQLVPLPGDLLRELESVRQQLQDALRRADEEKSRADEETGRANEERRRADEETSRTNEEKRRADEEKSRADEEKRRADEWHAQFEEARRAREAAEEELARLRAQLKPNRKQANGS